MKCQHCENIYPSKYHFITSTIRIESFKSMPVEKQIQIQNSTEINPEMIQTIQEITGNKMSLKNNIRNSNPVNSMSNSKNYAIEMLKVIAWLNLIAVIILAIILCSDSDEFIGIGMAILLQ